MSRKNLPPHGSVNEASIEAMREACRYYTLGDDVHIKVEVSPETLGALLDEVLFYRNECLIARDANPRRTALENQTQAALDRHQGE